MNDLLFYALIIALLYYFLVYLPQPKPIEPTKPLTHSQFTQTETIKETANPELESQLDHLIQEIQSLCSKLN